MTREEQRRRALTAVEIAVAEGADADDVLREVVHALVPLYDSVAIDFVEEGRILRGPSRGHRSSGPGLPVRFDGAEVARLTVAPAAADDAAFLEHVTRLISAHCLVAWDTGGEPWNP